MENDLPANFLERMEGLSTASDSSEDQDSLQSKRQGIMELNLTLQTQSEGPPCVSVSVRPPKESTKSCCKSCQREPHRKRRSNKDLVQLQPISASLCLGESSTLRGTPWEDALSSSNESTRPSVKHSTKAAQPDRKSFKEMKMAAFWQQFFG